MILESRYSIEELQEQATAELILAQRLRNGQLVLFLGSGASKSIGLPIWFELVRSCCAKASVNVRITSRSSTTELQHIMSQVRHKCEEGASDAFEAKKKYFSLVREALYEQLPPTWVTNHKMPLMRAIGALVMGSRYGTINDVVTYNFDDIVETYLQYHGFTAQSIADLPSLTTDCDACVYHPHGYLPQKGDHFSKRIILDRQSFSQQLGIASEDNQMWRDTLIQLLSIKQALFIGVSGQDNLLDVAMPAVVNYIRDSPDRRAVGYWLFGSPVSNEVRQHINETYMGAVLTFPDYDYIPEFLLKLRRMSIQSHSV